MKNRVDSISSFPWHFFLQRTSAVDFLKVSECTRITKVKNLDVQTKIASNLTFQRCEALSSLDLEKEKFFRPN